MTTLDTLTYISNDTQTKFMMATVTSMSISTYMDPTTYISTVLSTYVMDEVS